jgi:hypothetical protein
MIGIKSSKSLATLLGLQVDELKWLSDNTHQFIRRLILINTGSKKTRDVLEVRGLLRRCQEKLLRKLFAKTFTPSQSSHGGVPGRSIKTNASPHLNSQWIFTTDVSGFYPSIHRCRVYRFFCEEQNCSPAVARALTKLCTIDHHLALGLVTSPILADQLFQPIDRRLAALADSRGLAYTRYVNDITFSGGFDFVESGIPELVGRVVAEHGFAIKRSKQKMGQASDPGIVVTQLCLRGDRLDVREEYLEKLVATIQGLQSLENGDEFSGEYVSRSQLLGRVHFVCWVNSRHRKRLRSMMGNLDWRAIEDQAARRGLAVERTALVPFMG